MTDLTDNDLLYNPDGDTLRKLYPEVEVDDTVKSGFVKEPKFKRKNPHPYVSFKDLNEGKDEFESIEPVPGIEIGIAGTF